MTMTMQFHFLYVIIVSELVLLCSSVYLLECRLDSPRDSSRLKTSLGCALCTMQTRFYDWISTLHSFINSAQKQDKL